MMLHEIRPAAMPQAHFYANLDGIHDVRVRQATQFIEQRIDKPLSIDAIARYVGLSSRQLERLFHAALGIGPAGFQRNLGLEYGRLLLSNSSRTITDIAIDCGFADWPHFSWDFKSAFGSSPRESRVKTTESISGEWSGLHSVKGACCSDMPTPGDVATSRR
jgi:transcriptional regulator GlxA family with amidase domain